MAAASGTLPPAVKGEVSKYQYPCLNITQAYFRKVVSSDTSCFTVIAKVSLLAFPLIAALVALEAAFDLLLAPIVFIANKIAGPVEAPTPVPSV